MIATRPDLAYAASTLGQFNSQPTSLSIQAVKRVLRYLKSTGNYGLKFPTKNIYITQLQVWNSQSKYLKEELIERPIGYTDSAWAGDKFDRKSTYGYVFT